MTPAEALDRVFPDLDPEFASRVFDRVAALKRERYYDSDCHFIDLAVMLESEPRDYAMEQPALADQC